MTSKQIRNKNVDIKFSAHDVSYEKTRYIQVQLEIADTLRPCYSHCIYHINFPPLFTLDSHFF